MQTEENRFAAADRLKLDRPNIEKIESVREKIRNQPFESAFAWDVDGNLVAARDGVEHKVVLKGREYKAATGGVLLHSHPNHTPFSDDDLTIAKRFCIARMEVVSKKFHYLFEPPTGGWGRISAPVWDAELSKFAGECDTIALDVKRERIAKGQALERLNAAALDFSISMKCHYSRIEE